MLVTPAALATTGGQLWISSAANAGAMRAPASSTVSTSQTSGSTTYADLTTPGPSVTVTSGTSVIVMYGTYLGNDSTGARTLAGVSVNGAAIPDDNNSLSYDQSLGGRSVAMSRVTMFTGLTPGSNTFKMQYRVSGGTGTWIARHLIGFPL